MGSKIHIVEETDDWNPITGGMHRLSDNGDANLRTRELSPETGLIIDKAAYTVYLKGIKIPFPKKEFELLLLLASNPRKVFKRIEILSQVWGRDYKPKDSRSLDVHIRMLRKKLQDQYITTIRGVGYKLEK